MVSILFTVQEESMVCRSKFGIVSGHSRLVHEMLGGVVVVVLFVFICHVSAIHALSLCSFRDFALSDMMKGELLGMAHTSTSVPSYQHKCCIIVQDNNTITSLYNTYSLGTQYNNTITSAQ
jgi:hypothetical protein